MGQLRWQDAQPVRTCPDQRPRRQFTPYHRGQSGAHESCRNGRRRSNSGERRHELLPLFSRAPSGVVSAGRSDPEFLHVTLPSQAVLPSLQSSFPPDLVDGFAHHANRGPPVPRRAKGGLTCGGCTVRVRHRTQSTAAQTPPRGIVSTSRCDSRRTSVASARDCSTPRVRDYTPPPEPRH